MRKFLLLTVIGALGVTGAAQAAKPPHPAHPPHGHHGKACSAYKRGYNAAGTLVSSALAPDTGHDRDNGTVVAGVTRANHRAPTGAQTFTLTDARVVFHHGVDPAAPAAGSRVGLHGTIIELPKRCSTTGFTPTITVRHVDVRQAKPATP
jgi:hypothetical protein